jgi:hypothetical protein
MYLRVLRGRGDSARQVDETASQQAAAAIRGLPGCLSFMRGFDRTTGQFITVSTWDTEEHARSPDAFGDLRSTIQARGVQLEAAEIYELTIPG